MPLPDPRAVPWYDIAIGVKRLNGVNKMLILSELTTILMMAGVAVALATSLAVIKVIFEERRDKQRKKGRSKKGYRTKHCVT